MAALFGFASTLRNQIDELRKQGPKAKPQLDKTVQNFAAFLAVLGKQDKMPIQNLLFLAQSYGSLGMHSEAAELLERSWWNQRSRRGKEEEQQKQVQLYRGGRMLLAHELRLCKKFKEAKEALDQIEKEPWGKGIQVHKEKILLLEDQEIYGGDNGAVMQWTAVMRQLRPKITQNPDAKELYYEAYFHTTHALYKYALKLTDEAKKKLHIQRAAKLIHSLETDRPEHGRRRFQEAL